MFLKMCHAQKGRSMMEMVGVLFIVGLLSVLGLSGYRMVSRHVAYAKIETFLDQFFTTMMKEYYLPTKNNDLHCIPSCGSTPLYCYNATRFICKSLDAEFCEGTRVSYNGHYFVDHGKESDLYFGWEVSPSSTTKDGYLFASFWTSSPEMCVHVLEYIQARDSYWEVISKLGKALVGRGNVSNKTFPLSENDIQTICQPISSSYNGRTPIPFGLVLTIPTYSCD